jgi:5'-deoxynucleotidase YfbR-like HD superfamily hydrolase
MGVLIQPEDRWLLGAAILHDADERRNGDVPFPVKRSSPEIKSLMDRLALQEQMDNLFVITALSKRQQTLLKLADMLEGLHWCLSGKERRNQQVSHKWMKALLQMLLDEHQTLEDGEAERFWQIMCAVTDIHPDWHGSMYSTFQAFLNTNPPKP